MTHAIPNKQISSNEVSNRMEIYNLNPKNKEKEGNKLKQILHNNK
jgi:hypothetical protein